MALSVSFSRDAWAESIWNTAIEMSTCRAHEELSSFLGNDNYACRRNAPPRHRELTGYEWLAAAGLSACYFGWSDHIPRILSGYRYSVTTDRKRYHNVVCTRSFFADEIESAKTSRENWIEELLARA